MLLSHFHKSKIEAGLDEVGRGCLAGPVVAAAVIFPKDYYNPSINDSKKLKASQREKIEIEILKNAICWKIGLADNREIDKFNILKASILAMHRCVKQLDVKPELLLVDGNKFYNYPGIPHICFIKGDTKFISIAAASILAKNYRDRLMKELAKEFSQYDWHKNVGYPTPAHKDAILKFGITPLHRSSFAFVRNNSKIVNADLLTHPS